MNTLPADEPRLSSMVCRRAHWECAWYTRWGPLFIGAQPVGGGFVPAHIRYHRKHWEWAAIAQALDERGMLAPGRRGCGFAVGREPLACLFARHGADILVTDLAAADDNAGSWSATGQHAASLDALYWPDLVSRETFDARVRFAAQDMRALRPAELGTFDFLWSSCSFEHLGDLESGLQFVLRSADLLRPGGVAVHTTEFNLSSGDATLATGDSVIYRQRDIASLARRLRLIGCAMERFDDFAGTEAEDIEYDTPPYYENDRQHVKLLLGGFVSTSCLLIITKGRAPATPPSQDAPAVPAQSAAAPTPLSRLRRSALWRATAPLRAPLRALLGCHKRK
jgi:hypothetical protein